MTTTDLSVEEIGARADEIYTRAQDQLGWTGMLDTPEDRATLAAAMDPADRAELLLLDAAAGRKLRRVGEDARQLVESRQRARQIHGEIDRLKGRGPARGHSPLLVSEVHLRGAWRRSVPALRSAPRRAARGRNPGHGDRGHRHGRPGGVGDAGQIRQPTTLRQFARSPTRC